MGKLSGFVRSSRWYSWLALSCAVMIVLGSPSTSVGFQDKPIVVTLEIFPEQRGAFGAIQDWMKALRDVGASRVKMASGGPAEASIKENETANSISIRVKGFLKRGKLVLPGGTYSLREVGKIKSLISGFRRDGAEVTLSEKKAFGLTGKQLVWLHSQLNVKVEFSTKDQKLGSVVAKLRKPLEEKSQVAFMLDGMAKRLIASDTVVTEELRGLSTGTSLAAMLRPHGLVLEPVHIKANEIQLHIKNTLDSKEHWPVGWPLQAAPVRVEPKMFEKMPIQIKNFPLDKVLNAVQKKADVPFLYDWNTMARREIELGDFKVSLKEKNAALAVVASRLLSQTKPRMFHEMRMDENGKGFLWISAK